MAVFPTTRWSLIQAAVRPPGEIAAAWSELVRSYRPAIAGFFRRSQLARDADDLTQEFLLQSMRDGWWSRADPDIGSFRRFLLVLLKRFLAQQRDAGHRRFEETHANVPESESDESPERQFDLQFALCLTRQAMRELSDEYAQEGRSELFAALQPWLAEPPAHGELVALGAKLEVAPNTLAVQLKRLRLRFQKAMRELLLQLSADAQRAETELHALRHALATGGSR